MTRSSKVGGVLLACLALAGGVVNAQEANPALRHPAADAAESRLLVKFRDTGATKRAQAQQVQQVQAATDKVAALASRTGMKVRSSHALGPSWHVVELEPGASAQEQLARIQADDGVAVATLDKRRYPHALPNDPLYSGQWYEQTNATNASAINSEAAWDTGTGTNGVVIAVLDTGVRFDHPDLGRAENGGRLLPGYDFITDSRIANDGDGRDADPTDTGDFLTQTEAATDFFKNCGGAGNSSWHGTRTAGIIGARTNDAEGIAGGTWSPWIVPVRVLGKCGGFDSDIIDAMLWAGGVHISGVPDNPYPAQIENMSLGAAGACGQAYADAIATLSSLGVVVVVSAGNEGGPVDSPANCPGAVGVAGLRHIGTKVGFSSLGPEVALSAPGGNCVNVTGGPCLFPINTTSNSGTTTPGTSIYTDQLNPSVGTSFSAPIVAGIAGLMLGANGNLGAAQIRARLREGAISPFPVNNDPTSNPPVQQCHVPTGPNDVQPSECNCTTSTCGAGMANAPGALLAALRPIAAVVTPGTGISGGQNVALSAAGSAAACGRTIVSYSWTGAGLATPPNQATATFVAPTSGIVTATVTVTDDAGRQDSADVVLTSNSVATAAPANAGAHACRTAVAPPLPVTVAVDPPTVTLVAAGSQTFTATVTNATNTDVSWSVDGIVGGSSTTGTITTAGVFTAPATVASALVVTVTATSAADSTKTASATVTVNPAPAQPQSSGGGGGGGGGGAFGLLEIAGLAALGLFRRRRVLQR